MQIVPGLEILEEQAGTGRMAASGDTVRYDMRMFLNRGDEVPIGSSTQQTILGKRRVIPAVEKALIGMRSGGYRKVCASPHLAYSEASVDEVIPPRAVLYISLWLRDIAARQES